MKKKLPENSNNAIAKRALKKFGILALNFVVLYSLLHLIILASERFACMPIFYAGMTVYGVAIGGLFIAYYILNGFSFDKTEITADDLSDKWDDERKRKYLAELGANREKAKKLIYFLFPLVLTMLIYYIEINFFA